jgi:hypothetical protein
MIDVHLIQTIKHSIQTYPFHSLQTYTAFILLERVRLKEEDSGIWGQADSFDNIFF